MSMEQIISGVVAAVFALLWYLLKRKDEAQERHINILFAKIHDSETKVGDLRLEIAKDHYLKDEVERRFEKLEKTFKEGFEAINMRLEKLTDILQSRRENDK